jgi:hypothetical protein
MSLSKLSAFPFHWVGQAQGSEETPNVSTATSSTTSTLDVEEKETVNTPAISQTISTPSPLGATRNYDCGADFLKRDEAWSADKMKFCCEFRVKCSANENKPAYNCSEGLADWHKKWPEAKKAWCCNGEQDFTCPTSKGNESNEEKADVKAGSPCEQISKFCPVAKCAAAPTGCKYVKGDLVVHVDGSCCPKPCQMKCEDEGLEGKNVSNVTAKSTPGEDELCPDGGVHAHSRCWYLSEQGAACVPTCEKHELEFSWYVVVPPHDKPMLPQLLDIEPTGDQSPPGLLECFAPGGSKDNIASKPDDASSVYPGNWSRPDCQLACPCRKAQAEKARPTETQASDFELYAGMNCFPGRGATAMPLGKKGQLEGGHDLLSRCQDKCLAESQCEGVILPNGDTELPLCWLRMNVEPERCAPNKGYDLWLKKEKVSKEDAGEEASAASKEEAGKAEATETLGAAAGPEKAGKVATLGADATLNETSSSFILHPGVNCYRFHGATPLPQSAKPLEGDGGSLFARCQKACLAQPKCEGIVMGPGLPPHSNCWLRMGIVTERCQPNKDFNLWLRSESSLTTTTVGVTPKPKFDCHGGESTLGWTVEKYEWCCEKEHIGCLEETGIVGRSQSLERRPGGLVGGFGFAAGGAAKMCVTVLLVCMGLVGFVLLAVAGRRRSRRPDRGWSSLRGAQVLIARARDEMPSGCECRSDSE